MKLDFWKRLWQKTFFRVILIIIAVILVIAFFVNRYWSPVLADKVKSTVLKSSDSLYRINFSDIKLHILEGRIVLYNITLTPDTAVFEQKKKQGTAPNNLYELHIKKLVLSHVHPFKLYFRHQLDISQIVVSAPELNVTHHLDKLKDTTLKDYRTIYQKIEKSLKIVHVGHISFNDVKLKYTNRSKGVVSVSFLKDLNLEAKELLIDSATQFDKRRFMFCTEVLAELNNYSSKPVNNLYHYKVKQITFSTLTRQINLYGFNFESNYKPGTFFEKTYRNRVSATLDTLQLNNFDFDLYGRTNHIAGSSLNLKNGSVNLFSNPKSDPKVMNQDRVNTFPNFLLSKIKADFILDTIHVHRININYEEYNPQSKKTGHITFINTHGNFYNITTDPVALKKNSISNVQLYSYFMGRGRVDIMASFNLTDSARSFSYKGTVGPMDLTRVNVASMPLGLVKINTGQVKRFTFDIHGNRKESHGQVSLQYNNLKVTVLKADTNEHRLKHKLIESLYANIILLKSNNPDNPDEAPRSFNVSYQRKYNIPFFKAAWRTLLIGIKSSAGFDEKKQEKAAQKMSERDQKKADRQKRKAARKQRRAERKRKRQEKRRQKKLEKELEKQSKH